MRPGVVLKYELVATASELPMCTQRVNGNGPPTPVLFTHPGMALLWVPTLEGAPARAPGGCVFEEQVGVGVHNSRVSERTDV